MYYDKQIHYIDYLENGEKKYNCGYVKITVSGGRLTLEMQIKGLYETDDVAAEVMLEGAGTESRIGSVMILQGGGSFRWEIRDPIKEGEEISVRDGLRYGQLERIHVHISPRRSLQCVWRKPVAPVVTEEGLSGREEEKLPMQMVPVEEKMPGREGEKLPMQTVSVEEEMPEREGEKLPMQTVFAEEGLPERKEEELSTQTVSMKERLPEPEEEEGLLMQTVSMKERVSEPEEERPEQPVSKACGMLEPEADMQEIPTADIPAEMTEASREISEAAMPEQSGTRNMKAQQERDSKSPPQTREAQRRSLHGPRTAAMSEDKWRQLWKIYPHIRPFRDEREYLSLWPEDFVVLRSDAYRLAHNSFLLHGYYNYEHLILTQMSVKGMDRYYIGVPGNFYEKEKQVAIMFGFESFECRQEPAQEGDFGYYMIRVEL